MSHDYLLHSKTCVAVKWDLKIEINYKWCIIEEYILAVLERGILYLLQYYIKCGQDLVIFVIY